MTRVSTIEGIAYGYRMMAYYLLVIVAGQAALGAGAWLVSTGAGTGFGQSPDWGLLVAGAVVALFGLLTVLAGGFGAGYKLIADGVDRGGRSPR